MGICISDEKSHATTIPPSRNQLPEHNSGTHDKVILLPCRPGEAVAYQFMKRKSVKSATWDILKTRIKKDIHCEVCAVHVGTLEGLTNHLLTEHPDVLHETVSSD